LPRFGDETSRIPITGAKSPALRRIAERRIDRAARGNPGGLAVSGPNARSPQACGAGAADATILVKIDCPAATARRGRKTLDDDKAVDFTPQEGVQERAIIAERHTSIRLTVGTEHVRMCKYSIAAEHLAFVDRNETNSANPVEKLLAQGKIIDIRRRGPSTLDADIAGIV
jgi:hypothetical protein